jgi:hypothetical protein
LWTCWRSAQFGSSRVFGSGSSFEKLIDQGFFLLS